MNENCASPDPPKGAWMIPRRSFTVDEDPNSGSPQYELRLLPTLAAELEGSGESTDGPSCSPRFESSFGMFGKEKIIIVMVGLPARGKTFTARRLHRYLSWLGVATAVFNVGNYRRKLFGAEKSSDFFDHGNEEGVRLRQEAAQAALQDVIVWMDQGGQIAIYDATNSTKQRRAWIRDMILSNPSTKNHQVIFMETVCDDPDVIKHNIREVKLNSPDYLHSDPEAAVRDFVERIRQYERCYVSVTEDEGPFIRVENLGQRMMVSRITGYMPSRVVTFMMHVHTLPRKIYLTRHGESIFNVENRIGGDSDLSVNGRSFARELAAFCAKLDESDRPATVFTSTLKRSRNTGQHLSGLCKILEWKALDEIDAGLCDGLTYKEVESTMPDEFQARNEDKLSYRYPRGESYEDLIQRLEMIILELERRRENILVVGHQAVCRALYAYFMDEPISQVPHIEMPLHTVLELSPKAYRCDLKKHVLNVPTWSQK